jgi:putative hydrolases of HD superfamily
MDNLLSIFNYYNALRATTTPDGRSENDAEHSWSLSFIYFYLQVDLEAEFGKLDSEKILKLLMIHDIGEVSLAGDLTYDVPTWSKIDSDKNNELEVAKIELVTKMNRQDLYDLYLELEETRPCLEVKIARSIDRIAPVLIRIACNNGWHSLKGTSHFSKQKLDERQLPRHEFSTTMTKVYNKYVDIALAKNMFPN